MQPVTSLPLARRLKKLIGEYETESYWWYPTFGMDREADAAVLQGKPHNPKGGWQTYPAPSFGELIRLLPAIGEKLGWPKGGMKDYLAPRELLELYMLAVTPQLGMKAVEDYLAKLLV